MTNPQHEPTDTQHFLSQSVRDYAKTALECLPIYAHMDAIASALKASATHALVLTAETAAGKSTAVPFALLDAFKGNVLMLEPRRLAALSVATRCADIAHDAVGNLCGYRMHLDSRVSDSTRFCVLTEAVLVRMMQSNPSLDGVSVVVLDEFHERSIHSDLALAFLKELLLLRDDLYVLVMSATIDTQKLCTFLECPSYRVSGRRFDVAVTYLNVPVKDAIERAVQSLLHKEEDSCLRTLDASNDTKASQHRAAPNATPQHRDATGAASDESNAEVPCTAPDALADASDSPRARANTILVFLPGIADIRRTEKDISYLCESGIDVRILHSSVPFAEQKKVLSPNESAKPRVILSSSVAETSLTVPGVCMVIDSGLARVNRFDAQTGMNRLVTEPETEFSAVQRAGRAGRTANGTCYRLWAQHDARISDGTGEIMRSDLTALVLECARWGARGIDGIDWLEKPPEGAWNAAVDYLTQSRCLKDGAITQKGKDVLTLGVHPRIALVALSGTKEALEYAVAYSGAQSETEREKLTRDLQKRLLRLQNRTNGSEGNGDCFKGDFGGEGNGDGGTDGLYIKEESSRTKAQADKPEITRNNTKAHSVTVKEQTARAERTAPKEQSGSGSVASNREALIQTHNESKGEPAPDAAEGYGKGTPLTGSAVLLEGFFDRLACLDGGALYRFPSGRKAALVKDGGNGKNAGNDALLPKWIIAVRVDGGEREGRIYEWVAVSGIESWLHQRSTAECDVYFTGGKGDARKVRRVERLMYGKIVLSERTVPPEADDITRAYASLIQSEGLECMPWNKESRAFYARAVFWYAHDESRAEALFTQDASGGRGVSCNGDASGGHGESCYGDASGGRGVSGNSDASGARGESGNSDASGARDESCNGDASGGRGESGNGDASGARQCIERSLEQDLISDCENWLIPFVPLRGALTEELFLDALRYKLDGTAVDRNVPTRLTLENGRTVRVTYENAGANGEAVPVTEVIIQKIFGCKTTPRICGVPVLFRLLSPARRPLQITSDLQGFWRTTWSDICKEMKGRYPKHNWDASKADDSV